MDNNDQLLNEKGSRSRTAGLREKALRRDDALKAISLLASSDIAVLGGDVYILRAPTRFRN
jgi:hypothetical protein